MTLDEVLQFIKADPKCYARVNMERKTYWNLLRRLTLRKVRSVDTIHRFFNGFGYYSSNSDIYDLTEWHRSSKTRNGILLYSVPNGEDVKLYSHGVQVSTKNIISMYHG